MRPQELGEVRERRRSARGQNSIRASRAIFIENFACIWSLLNRDSTRISYYGPSDGNCATLRIASRQMLYEVSFKLLHQPTVIPCEGHVVDENGEDDK